MARPPVIAVPMNEVVTKTAYRTWMCVVCGFIYDEAAGLPEEGIAPGTRWEDIPDTWTCPDCGGTKDDFEMELAWRRVRSVRPRWCVAEVHEALAERACVGRIGVKL
jgi:rubredoxin